MERYKTPSAVIVLLTRKQSGRQQYLLQKRQNTGFGDGMWDLSCSGHVEEGESMTEAAVRECLEELGIRIKREDLKFFSLIHKRDETYDKTYYNAYFRIDDFTGEPKIMEPHKCAQLDWFDFDKLPENLLHDRKCALNAQQNRQYYIEYGWVREQ